jgi:hypothetical protein
MLQFPVIRCTEIHRKNTPGQLLGLEGKLQQGAIKSKLGMENGTKRSEALYLDGEENSKTAKH